jgi:hypothetical protein
MSAPITGIDHLLVGVRDLEAARGRYERLGFALTPRGSHVGWGTANYCIMFEDDYVELLGIVDASRFTNNLDKFLAAREGLMGLAFATGDAQAAAEELRARGIAAEGPKALERRLELPEGAVMPRFALVFLPGAATPGLSAFICHHLTPRLLRRAEWLRHANGAGAIASLTGVVERPASLTPAYERLLGPDAVSVGDRRLTLRLGRHQISLVDPASPLALAGVAAPYLAGMTLACDNRDRTASWLESQALRFERERDGSILVPPEEACGLWLRFG